MTEFERRVRKIDFLNRYGTVETYRQAVYALGAWTYVLCKRGRINPAEITMEKRRNLHA